MKLNHYDDYVVQMRIVAKKKKRKPKSQPTYIGGEKAVKILLMFEHHGIKSILVTALLLFRHFFELVLKSNWNFKWEILEDRLDSQPIYNITNMGKERFESEM